MAIQSVNRALDILFLFSNVRPQMGITEISECLGLTKPTVHGLVRTLTQRGFLHQDSRTRKYSLGLKIYELGTYLAQTLKINQISAAPAQRLAEETNLVVRVAIWDQNAILVTLNIFPGTQTSPFEQLGPRVPAYCSALGKAILAAFPPQELQRYLKHTVFTAYSHNTITEKKQFLAELEQARSLGYAQDKEEYLPGLACISSAIFDHTGIPMAAISLSSLPAMLFADAFPSLVQAMRQSAEEISHKMGFSKSIPL